MSFSTILRSLAAAALLVSASALSEGASLRGVNNNVNPQRELDSLNDLQPPPTTSPAPTTASPTTAAPTTAAPIETPTTPSPSSSPPTSGEPAQAAATGGDFCFSAHTTVQVRSKGKVNMADLQVGDQLLTKSHNANQDYSTVYAFGHYNPQQHATFLQIYTDQATAPLEMTPEHLVLLQDKKKPVRAGSLQVGDVLEGATTATATIITQINSVQRMGVYAPLTTDGTLVVNGGIVVSSYVSLADKKDDVLGGFLSYHDYSHVALAPLRLLCQGISTKFGSTYTADGLPHYAAFGIGITQWLLQQHVIVQAVAFYVIFLLTGTCYLVEAIFGATWGPSIVFVLAGFLAGATNGSFRVRITSKRKSV